MKAFRRLKRTFYSKQVKKIDLGKGLSIFLKLVYTLNVILAFLLLLACIAPYIIGELFSFLSFLSLIVPYLVLANILFVLYWLFKRKRQLLLSFSVLLLGYLTQETFLKVFNSNDNIKDDDISLLTFNTNGFSGLRWTKNPVSSEEIVEFINTQNADIICFQEYNFRKTKNFEQYPYKYVNYIFPSGNRVVQAIMSKYPIIKNGSLDFPESSNNAIYADLLIKNDTFRVYNLHLQSLSFRAGMLKREEPQRLFKRLDKSFQKQQEQAKLVHDHSMTVNYKKIICGDFNNTQFSSVYNTIKGKMNDTFLEKGSGLGSTYNIKFLPFRIDFILTDPGIEIKSHKNFDEKLSDHYAVMASFRLKE